MFVPIRKWAKFEQAEQPKPAPVEGYWKEKPGKDSERIWSLFGHNGKLITSIQIAYDTWKVKLPNSHFDSEYYDTCEQAKSAAEKLYNIYVTDEEA